MKQNIPSSEQAQVVINNLKKAEKKASIFGLFENPFALDMSDGHVDGKHNLCKTSFCHGGWYAYVAVPKSPHRERTFSDGADLMAAHLGFDGMMQLRNWANFHPEIWGNLHGVAMFGMSGIAFFHPDKRPHGAKSLRHIREHWEEVRDRIIAIEEKERVAKEQKYTDITPEIANLPFTKEASDLPIKQTMKHETPII